MQWPSWDPSTKVILKVAIAGIALVFLWAIRDIIIVLLLSVVLASAMEPLVAYLHRRKIPRAVSVLAVYILVIGIAALVLWLLVPIAVDQFKVLSQNLPQYTAQFQDRFPGLHSLLGNSNLSDVVKSLFGEVTKGSLVFTGTVGIFNGFFTVITILVISFYLVAEQQGMMEFVRSVVPPTHRDFAMALVRKVQTRMGLWVIGQLILSFCIFVITYVGLSILGVHYALFLALLAGLLEVVPYIGPFLSAVPSVFFALVQNPPLAVAVIVLYVIIQKTEGYVLVPKVMQKTVGASPLLVLVSLLVGFKLAGILGLLLAVPLVSAITLVIEEMSANHQAATKAVDSLP
jgi:predicted PurR-regulated permease PerM